MNPPHPYPCKACEVEQSADRERAAFMAGYDASSDDHHGRGAYEPEDAYTAWLATQQKEP